MQHLSAIACSYGYILIHDIVGADATHWAHDIDATSVRRTDVSATPLRHHVLAGISECALHPQISRYFTVVLDKETNI